VLLIAVNYKEEIDYDYFSKYDFVEIKIFNERKWSMFALKLQKYILDNHWKYDIVLHFWLCWWKHLSQIWNIYKIDRSFLYNNEIIDNQRSRFWKNKFNNIDDNNIVTKFSVWKHSELLYDFWDIYDIETFWVSQLSVLIWTPIVSIKWVSDINDSFIYDISEKEEIEFLLNPDSKRQRKQIFINRLKDNINIVNTNFINFFESEFITFYDNYKNNSSFRKKLLTE